MRLIFPGVWEIGDYLVTENLTPGKVVYNERLIKKEDRELRTWNPYRSKLAAAIRKGLRSFPFSKAGKVLYLGASTGTTVSHVSDIVGKEGVVYAVEISPHAMKNLIKVAEQRSNILPIMADARKTENYKEIGQVDIIYQDVAQPDQDDIIIKNAAVFLRPHGYAFLAIKSQSIDVTQKPQQVFERVLAKLGEHFEILEKMKLEPFDKDHLFVVMRRI